MDFVFNNELGFGFPVFTDLKLVYPFADSLVPGRNFQGILGQVRSFIILNILGKISVCSIQEFVKILYSKAGTDDLCIVLNCKDCFYECHSFLKKTKM